MLETVHTLSLYWPVSTTGRFVHRMCRKIESAVGREEGAPPAKVAKIQETLCLDEAAGVSLADRKSVV